MPLLPTLELTNHTFKSNGMVHDTFDSVSLDSRDIPPRQISESVEEIKKSPVND